MKYKEAKEELIHAWGVLGQSWGLNKTMAQIHALLMVSTKPLSTEEIMEELNISRGNANMNIRALLEWSIIERILVPGERKEYFKSEKDVWTLARTVAKERRRRELYLMCTDKMRGFSFFYGWIDTNDTPGLRNEIFDKKWRTRQKSEACEVLKWLACCY